MVLSKQKRKRLIAKELHLAIVCLIAWMTVFTGVVSAQAVSSLESIDAIPYNITSPRYYILNINYTGSGEYAIVISASDVVLDLNEHIINNSGILCECESNVTVINGVVTLSQMYFDCVSKGKIEHVKFDLGDIYLKESKSIEISNNTWIDSQGISITLEGCTDVIIKNNTIRGSLTLLGSQKIEIINNTFIGQPIEPCLEIAIDLRESSDNTIYGNTYTGIWIYDSNTQQYYPSGLFGIYLENSNRNKLLNNEIEGTCGGIKLYSSTENIIFRNKLKDNINGTTVIDSINNVFYLNDFVNNTVNVYSKNSTNIWNSTTVYSVHLQQIQCS